MPHPDAVAPTPPSAGPVMSTLSAAGARVPAAAGSRSWLWLWMVLIGVLAIFAHHRGFANGWIWDDDQYVIDNVTLRSADGLRRIWLEPGAVPQYYPLVHTTFWLQYRVWRTTPGPYHVVNVLCHALAAALLFRLLLRVLQPGLALRDEEGHRPAADGGMDPGVAAWKQPWWPFAVALGTALLFAVHPMHVESVAWVTERKNVLSAVFYCGAGWLYLQAVNWPDLTWRWERRTVCLHAGALLLFLAALFSKTITCSLPAVLLLLLWWRGRPWTPAYTRSAWVLLPWLAVGAALALFTAHLEKTHVGAVGPEWDNSLADKVLIASRSLWFYIGKLAWPEPLIFFYERWQIDPSQARQWLWLAAWLPVAALLLYLACARGRRGPLVTLCIYGGTLLPALGFFALYPQLYSFVADHFCYLGSVPILLLAVVLVLQAGQWLRGHLTRRRLAERGLRRLGFYPEALLLTLLLMGLSLKSQEQTRVYASEETLWKDTIAKNSSSWSAYNNLGDYYRRHGDLVSATQYLQGALQIKPDHIKAMNNLALVYELRGEDERAIHTFVTALQIEENPVIMVNLGRVHMRRGELDRARICYDRALVISPGFVPALLMLGRLESGSGNYADAVTLYARILQRDPANRDAWIALRDAAQRGNIPASQLPPLPPSPF